MIRKHSSRRQIDIKEVRDGVLILPGGKYRTLLEASSVNFELKSDEEQDVLIDNFQNFLNSLPYPIQILIRIREIDIDDYLNKLSEKGKSEKEKVYIKQIKNYSKFVKKLVSGNKILSRRFYVVIPYESEDGKGEFSLVREQIKLNQDIVVKGLERLGMKTKHLDSIDVLELFYSFYNPAQSKTQQLKEKTFEFLTNV